MANRSVWRRIERWMVGIVMAIIAFVLEKAVVRSVRRGGRTAAPPEETPTTLTSKGGEVDV